MQTVLFAAQASTLAHNAIAFRDASVASDNAATPFARSTLAAIIGGSASADFAESMIIGAFGSPVSEKTGKPIAKVSGLREVDGGARVYQAWKDIAYIVANIDADQPVGIMNADGSPKLDANDQPMFVGTSAIRAYVVAFILGEQGSATALFGAKGLTANVKRMVAEHAKAVMEAHGVPQEEASKGDDAKADDMSLGDRINATLVAIQNATPEAFAAALPQMTALFDYLQSINAPATTEEAAPVSVAA